MPTRGRFLDIVIIAGLAGVGGLLVYQVFNESSTNSQNAASGTTTGLIAQEDRSIAVLPFVALSTNQDDEFFGKGISEELLNSLAKFPGLKVAARTSAFSFAGKDVDLRDVGEQLSVAHVLEGSVRRSGDQLRITAQLIRASDGFHLWSETYDRTLNDIFEIQDNIVAELSQVLQFRLGVGAGAGRAAGSKTTPQAYEIYLKGIDLWWRRDAAFANRTEAIRAFQQTTEIDPAFAGGWAALANSLALSSPATWPNLSLEDGRSLALNAYAEALRIEPRNARALAGKAYWLTDSTFDIENARESLEMAQSVAPNDTFVQYITGYLNYVTGDAAASSNAFERALIDDPLNNTKHRIRFLTATANGNYDPGYRFARRQIERVRGCIEEQSCTGAHLGSAKTLLDTASHAGSDEQFEEMADLLVDTRNSLEASPVSAITVQCTLTLFRFVRSGGTTLPKELQDCISEDNLVAGIGDSLSGVSLLGQAGLIEPAIAMLNRFNIFDTPWLVNDSSFVLTDGHWQMPDVIRRHPDYHAFWQQSGLPGLAAARRANGQDAGLPLPIEQ